MINIHDIVIRGGYGFGNFGDDALMHTVTKELHGSSRKIVLLCQPASYIKNLLPNIEVIDYHKMTQPLYCKLLLYGGGTQFYHFKKKKIPNRWKNKLFNISYIRNFINKRIFKNNYIENKFQIANYAQNIALVGVGVGPFQIENSSFENKTATLFRKSNFVGVRDEFAMKKAESWGVKNPIISPDICYSFKSEFLDKYINKAEKIKRIGFIVRDWNYANGGSEYYEKLEIAAAKLEEEGFLVTYILFDIVSDPFWYSKKEILNMIVWDPNLNSFDSFLNKISDFDLFITARFHGAIFSSLLQTPFITIEVEQKLRFIAETYYESSSCWHMPFDLEQLYSQIKLINENYVDRKKSVTNKMVEYKILSDQMFEDLKAYYNSL